jgi:secretion/DNA translocation related CpaE-like protein
LLIASRPGLVDDVLRLSAAAGVSVELGPEPGAVRASWTSAPLVLVEADAAAACVRLAFPRRPGVVVVSAGEPSEGVWRDAVAVGAERVAVLPDAEPDVVALLASAHESGIARGPVVACIGGRGGAGASVLAAALALTTARDDGGGLLVDLDPLGGGVDLVVGAERIEGLRWPALAAADGHVSADSLDVALPRVAGLSVLSMSRSESVDVAPAGVRAITTAVSRRGRAVVVDLPRALTEPARSAVVAADLVLVVVPADVRACAAAMSVVRALAESTSAAELVVRGLSSSGLSAEGVAEMLGLPLAGAMRAEPGLAAALERGDSPLARRRGPLATFCRDLLGRLREGFPRPTPVGVR